MIVADEKVVFIKRIETIIQTVINSIFLCANNKILTTKY